MWAKLSKSLLIAGALALMMLLGAGLALAALGNSLLNMSQTTTDAGYPAIDVSPDGNTIAVVWSERYSGGGAAQGPIYLKGAVDGTNLTVALTVDNSNSVNDQSWSPDVAVDPVITTNVHVVWRNRKDETTDYIYYTRCSLSARTCNATEEVASSSSNQILSDPRVAVSNVSGQSVVHVVWQEIDNGTSTRVIKYRGKSADGSFSAGATTLSGDPSNAYYSQPEIDVSTGSGGEHYVHFVWAVDTGKDEVNDKIQYRRGTVQADGTLTLDTVKDMPSPADPVSNPSDPVVTAGNGMVFVLWSAQNDNNSNLDSNCGGSTNCDDYLAVYSTSADDGNTFDTVARDVGTDGNTAGSYTSRMSDNNPSDTANPLRDSPHSRYLHLAADFQPGTSPLTGTLHVVWHQSVFSDTEYYHNVYYQSRLVGTGDCGDAENGCGWLAGNQNKKYSGHASTAYSMSPEIAVDNNGQIYVVYMEGSEAAQYQIYDSTLGNLGTFDIIFNGTKTLVDNTLKIYLPIVIKNAS